MFNVQNLTAYKNDMPCLHHVSFSLEKGQILSVLGINGSGKSSLALALSGHLKHTADNMTLHGKKFHNNTPQELMKKGIVLVPEQKDFFNTLNVEEHLELALLAINFFVNKKDIALKKEYIYNLFPKLFERRKQLSSTLSGGELQMLLIAQALMIQPEILIFDEPSQGLSVQMVDYIFNLFSDLKKNGIGIILIEQNIYQSLNISDSSIVLENGRVALQGKSVDIKTHPQLNKICLGVA